MVILPPARNRIFTSNCFKIVWICRNGFSWHCCFSSFLFHFNSTRCVNQQGALFICSGPYIVLTILKPYVFTICSTAGVEIWNLIHKHYNISISNLFFSCNPSNRRDKFVLNSKAEGFLCEQNLRCAFVTVHPEEV